MSTATAQSRPVYGSAIHLMEACGGSFVRSLAHCYLVADAENRTKLRAAFADVFDRYAAQYAELREGGAA